MKHGQQAVMARCRLEGAGRVIVTGFLLKEGD
jgi:hypothetical protein